MTAKIILLGLLTLIVAARLRIGIGWITEARTAADRAVTRARLRYTVVDMTIYVATIAIGWFLPDGPIAFAPLVVMVLAPLALRDIFGDSLILGADNAPPAAPPREEGPVER